MDRSQKHFMRSLKLPGGLNEGRTPKTDLNLGWLLLVTCCSPPKCHESWGIDERCSLYQRTGRCFVLNVPWIGLFCQCVPWMENMCKVPPTKMLCIIEGDVVPLIMRCWWWWWWRLILVFMVMTDHDVVVDDDGLEEVRSLAFDIFLGLIYNTF